jgi:hypothetical protein
MQTMSKSAFGLAEMPKVRVKPTVLYTPSKYGRIEVGLPATVRAWTHPSHLILPGDIVNTSTVQSYDQETGVFETRNSIYKPM